MGVVAGVGGVGRGRGGERPSAVQRETRGPRKAMKRWVQWGWLGAGWKEIRGPG